jgi:hypothetical protein
MPQRPEQTGYANPYSAPNAGFSTPENARRAALIFTAMGCTGDELRYGKHPGDRLMHELAGEVDKIAAEGLTPGDCLARLGIPPRVTGTAGRRTAPARPAPPAAATADAGATPRSAGPP